MFKATPSLSAGVLFQRVDPHGLGKDTLLSSIEAAISPGCMVLTLWAAAWWADGEISAPYLILSMLVFALTYPGKLRLHGSVASMVAGIMIDWALIAGLLLLTGWATHYLSDFSIEAISVWMWLAPISELAVSLVMRRAAPALLQLLGPPQRAIIVGMNEPGLAMARKIKAAPYAHITLTGFVDGRDVTRLSTAGAPPLIGKTEQLAELVKAQNIQLIYLSLPMASQPRILQILDDLKDTTASVYFVPDMFVTDLIQGQQSTVCGTPVISVCESPFKGKNGFVKRASDVVLSLLILTLILPVLAAIAIAVKATSPGPVIFKQRRYGLDGKEILVYKFRSMTVTEDGGAIKQAQKNDSRITPLGAFLRRTSLDELPQFVNVLQGRMSIVGPRPHAVAHNELYRKLIKGYMVRHKVKPGITGWAQVSGFRGETDTLEKMQGRIDYDLDYLRNWSLQLDLHIILKTVRLVTKDQQAY